MFENLINKSQKLLCNLQVPTINQDDATAGPEPTETLINFRSDKVLRPTQKSQGKVNFETYIFHCIHSIDAH